ncbi:MAG: hypothetical protein U0904_08765 [Candidatus Nanopelagicales bacterium]|nr:hypothetical protein [Candidatus Nanopelagicales bacterium]
MVEFKQIVGRGSRLYPENDKYSFEIVDYVGASVPFSDPGFDGEPVRIRTERIDESGEIVEDELGDVAPRCRRLANPSPPSSEPSPKESSKSRQRGSISSTAQRSL